MKILTKDLPAILTFYTLVILKFCHLTTALHWLVKTISRNINCLSKLVKQLLIKNGCATTAGWLEPTQKSTSSSEENPEPAKPHTQRTFQKSELAG